MYRWTNRHEVDTNRGLFVLFAAGAGFMLLACLSIAQTYNKQLRQFVDDVAGETNTNTVRFGGGGFEKAD